MQTRLLYANITSSIAGTVYVDLPRGSRLHKVDWAISTVSAPTTGDQLRCELSVGSSSQVSTNDATGIISMADASGFLTTSGAGLSSVNIGHAVDIQLGNITRVYLNVTEAGSATWSVRALLHFS